MHDIQYHNHQLHKKSDQINHKHTKSENMHGLLANAHEGQNKLSVKYQSTNNNASNSSASNNNQPLTLNLKDINYNSVSSSRQQPQTQTPTSNRIIISVPKKINNFMGTNANSSSNNNNNNNNSSSSQKQVSGNKMAGPSANSNFTSQF